MQRENVAWIDTTSRSIEELASTIVHQMRHDQENLEARAGIEPA